MQQILDKKKESEGEARLKWPKDHASLIAKWEYAEIEPNKRRLLSQGGKTQEQNKRPLNAFR